MVKRIWKATHAQRVGFNMLCCSLLLWPFGPWPRETFSGFFGRKALEGKRVAIYIATFIDWLHPHEPGHCYETAYQEYNARIALFYHE